MDDYLVEYHKKSLVSFVVFICSNNPAAVNELLPQIPGSSLYQLHDAKENSREVFECENEGPLRTF